MSSLSPQSQLTTTKEQMTSARDWVKDCMWADIESPEEVDDMSDLQIQKGVIDHYEGGWSQFVEDGGLA
jgi:hypothetical protein